MGCVLLITYSSTSGHGCEERDSGWQAGGVQAHTPYPQECWAYLGHENSGGGWFAWPEGHDLGLR